MAVFTDDTRAPLTARDVFSAVAALLAFYGAVLVTAVLVAVVFTAVVVGGLEDEGVAVVLGGGALVSAGMVINVGLVRAGLSRWPTLGWVGLKHTGVEFGKGTSLGVVMGLAAVALAIGVGDASVSLSGEGWGAFASAAGVVAAGLIVAALGEELVFRGYPLARLAKTIGRAKAAGVLAALFALMHLWNPEVSPLGLVNIWLASLVMSAAFFTTGGLPLAWGLHFGWNAGLGLLVDAPVSGIRFAIPTVEFAHGEMHVVTGGAFGPEGGMAATVALTCALVLLARRAAGTVEADVNEEVSR